jgi:peptide deformylase
LSLRIIRTGNDPVLRQIAKPVQMVTKAIEKLLDDMAETMYDAEGIGLAAVQIGITKRLIVVDIGEGLIELINPEIVEQHGSQIGPEGCLSLPGIRGDVKRSKFVTVRGMNRQGESVEFSAADLLARAFQHEIDHLNGILFTDYLKPSEIVYESGREIEQK